MKPDLDLNQALARYLHIVWWAKRRYSYRDAVGCLLLDISQGVEPSRYSTIEGAAFRRYIIDPRLQPAPIGDGT